MNLNTFPKSITDATENVHLFLRFCFLCRVKSQNGNDYTLENIFVGAFLVGIILCSVDLYLMIADRLVTYTHTLPRTLELLNTGMVSIRLIVTLYQASCESEAEVRKEFDNLTAIDQAFGVRSSDTYGRDRSDFNKIFFIGLTLRLMCLLACSFCYAFTYGIQVCVWFLAQYCISFLLSANMIYNASKLKLHSYRIFETKRQVDQLSTKDDIRIRIDRRKIHFCYLKMYENCVLFNERQGLQVLLCHADITLATITIISFTTKEESFTYASMIIAHISLLIMEIVPVIILLVLATSMLHTSKAISLTIERALVKRNFDSERERVGWEEFVELAHRCPLVLTAYDFFPLDYSLIGATFGTMVTYTIILTQLNS